MKNALSKDSRVLFSSSILGCLWKPRLTTYLLSYCLVPVMGFWILTNSCGKHEPPEQRLRWEHLSQIQNSSFVGAESAWLIRQNEGDLLYTFDGGRTWQTSPGKEVQDRFSAVSFLDLKHGWATNASGEVWETLDGGRSWRKVGKLEGTNDQDLTSSSVTQLQIMDELNGWAIGGFGIWRTVDSGRTWKKVLSISDHRITGQPSKAFFKDSMNLWVAATGGQVFRTGDGGVTWEIKTLRDGEDLTDICVTNQKIWVTGLDNSGQGNNLFFTNNGGESWESPRTAEAAKIRSCYFSTESEGWAVGSNQSISDGLRVSRGVVLHTIDGAMKWSNVPVDPEPFFTKIDFVDPQHGWLIGRDKVYRTTDGGTSWTSVLSLSPIKPKSAQP